MFQGPVERAGLVLPVCVDPAGRVGPTRWEARGPNWRRVGQGLYVPAEVDSTAVQQRIVEAAVALPDGGGVTGWAALAWLGTRWFDGLASDGRTPLPVPLSIRDRAATKRRQGALLAEDWLFPDDVVRIDGLPITVPERSVSFEARRARDLVRATQPIDMALAADLFTLTELEAYVSRLIARPGVRRLRVALALADENVWSPLETVMRLRWLAACDGVTLLCNAPLFDSAGRHLLTPDLFDPVACVAGQYDGFVHLEDRVRKRDLDKEAACRDHGIEVVTMLNSDLAARGSLERRLGRAYRLATGGRGWTLTQPDWWVDTSTVEARRALTAEQRERWLAWRTG